MIRNQKKTKIEIIFFILKLNYFWRFAKFRFLKNVHHWEEIDLFQYLLTLWNQFSLQLFISHQQHNYNNVASFSMYRYIFEVYHSKSHE